MTIEIKNELNHVILTGTETTLTNFANMILDKVKLKEALLSTFFEPGSKAIKIEIFDLEKIDSNQGAPCPPYVYAQTPVRAPVEKFKYEISFDFTKDSQVNLRENIWPETLAKRIIKSEFGLDPNIDNGAGDIRYATNDPEMFIELLKILQYASGGGWWCSEQMPQGYTVFQNGTRILGISS